MGGFFVSLMDKFGLFNLLSALVSPSAFNLFGEKKGEDAAPAGSPQKEETAPAAQPSLRANATADVVARQRALEERVRKNKPSE